MKILKKFVISLLTIASLFFLGYQWLADMVFSPTISMRALVSGDILGWPMIFFSSKGAYFQQVFRDPLPANYFNLTALAIDIVVITTIIYWLSYLVRKILLLNDKRKEKLTLKK
jgi:hypothetical protein